MNWHVLQTHHITDRFLKMLKDFPNSMEIFVPRLTLTESTKKGNRQEKLLTFNYIFVRGETMDILNGLKKRDFNMWMLYRKNVTAVKQGQIKPRIPLIVSDCEMEMFQRAVAFYKDGYAPACCLDPKVLERGDTVRITAGPFAGVEGTLVTSQGKEGGTVVVSIGDLVSVSTINIAPNELKILRFGKGNHHLYKKIESFKLRLSAIEKKLSCGAELSLEDRQHLTAFVNTFDELQTDTLNAEVKVKLLILKAFRFLRLDSCADEITNELNSLLSKKDDNGNFRLRSKTTRQLILNISRA